MSSVSAGSMSRRKRLAIPALAAGLTALVLPMSAGAPAQAAASDFGFSSLTTASPVKIEIFEPTIPIPAEPQAEFELGYTKVVADSSSSRSRATYLWPGDAIGEGAKTIFENLGLPPEIVAPIAEQGYPFQVNATYPSGPETEANEPFPGAVQRVGATREETYAKNGYDSNCDSSGGEGSGSGDDGGSGSGDGGGLPGLPDLPLPGLGGGGLFGKSTTARPALTTRSSARAASADETVCQIPDQFAALMTIGGYNSYSATIRSDSDVKVVSRTAMGDITLAGGVIEMSGLKAKVVATADGSKSTVQGSANYGIITIAGQSFAIGPEGIEGGGSKQPIPGLPDEPNAALAELGVTLTVPKPKYEVEGKRAKGTVEALIVEIDTQTLSDALNQLPLNDLISMIPDFEDDAKDLNQIKSALQAAVNASPRFVYHFGFTQAKVETADPIVIPPFETPETPDTETPTTDGGAAGGASSGGGSVSTGGVATTPTDSGGVSTDPGAAPLTDASLASGLPPLNSIPGLLLVGSIVGAALVGTYVRRLGLAALGAGGACSHGLESGLPDLRKA